MSVSMRSSRGLAVRMFSPSMPKVRYLVLARPLLPLDSWFFLGLAGPLRPVHQGLYCSQLL